MKNVIGVYTTPRSHWVGDGFPVRSLFAYDNHGKALSPFLLLDRAGPAQFAPASSLSDLEKTGAFTAIKHFSMKFGWRLWL